MTAADHPSDPPFPVRNPDWKLRFDADLYEAALERLAAENPAKAPEEALQELLSGFLGHLARAGKNKPYRHCVWELEQTRTFREERREAVVREFAGNGTERLREIASDPNAGCDGGNWASSLWVFGLEAGGTMRVDGKEGHFVDLTPHVGQPPESEIPTDDAERAAWFGDYPYNRFLLRFCLSFFGLAAAEETAKDGLPTPKLAERAVAARLFTPQGPCFKGNVYPLQRPSHEFWNRLSVRYKGFNLGPIEKALGLRLDQYKTAMIEARRPAFAEKIAENARAGRPTVIVCWGTADANNFADAFGARPEDFRDLPVEGVIGLKPPRLAPIRVVTTSKGLVKTPDTRLFVMPHPRMLAYSDMHTYAAALREALLREGVPEFWKLSPNEEPTS